MSNQRAVKEIDYKSVQLELKDVDTKSGIVCGYYAAFDNIDSYGDMIVKGAFKKTIAERGPQGTKQIKHLWQHDTWCPIGIPTLLKEDKIGLYFEAQFSKIQKAQETLTMYAEGILNEHSIGYRTIKEEAVTDESNGRLLYFKLTEIKLWEGSTVTWGANSNTPFTGFKSETVEGKLAELDKESLKLRQILKHGEFSDETLEQAELALIKLQESYKSLITEQPQRSTEQPKSNVKLKSIRDILS